METYTHEAIQQCIDLLDSLTVTGVANAKRVAVIAQILMNPLPNEERKEKTDGSSEKEQAVG